MKAIAYLFLFFLSFSAFSQNSLYLNKENKAVLFLFPGFGETLERMENNFQISEKANAKSISIVYLNFNHHLFLTDSEKEKLGKEIKIIIDNHFKDIPIYLGGFSSGGNMAMIMGDYLFTQKKQKVQGCFVIDSPLDLTHLHQTSQKNIARNVSAVSVNEAKYISSILTDDILHQYNNFNIEEGKINLSHDFIRQNRFLFFSEYAPDWWKKNRGNEWNETNYYALEKLYQLLKSITSIEFISTKNKGKRSDGTRHPHSWSIVDQSLLMDWILKEELPH